ncbi:MAG: hypothetical protein QXN55_01825 [Candidatus Nitrosotenuis sp.]
MAKKHILDNAKFQNPFIMEGFVMANDDPSQMGRCKIWCPSLDGENYNIVTLPWAEYASPLAGVTNDFPAGREATPNKGWASYGFWAIPKIGAQVLLFLLNGNPARRFYFASFFDLHRNRSIPTGRNKNDQNKPGPWTDIYEPLQPAFDNLRAQFQNQVESTQCITRGGFELQAAQAQTIKDGTDGYTPSAADPQKIKDPQTYCFVTPGHHALIMTDDKAHCRVRFKTTAGAQVILDDTNERIYVSTAKGNTWVELDEDGHVHIYGSASISVRAEQNINLTADQNISIEAGGTVDIKSGGVMRVSAGRSFNLSSGGSVLATACEKMGLTGNSGFLALGSEMHLTGVGGVFVTGPSIDLNGPAASSPPCPEKAVSPLIIPEHEPWQRPASEMTRNPNWRE